MLKNRIIPCLDVKNGRVVKGINFVDLQDAGDPVEQLPLDVEEETRGSDPEHVVVEPRVPELLLDQD